MSGSLSEFQFHILSPLLNMSPECMIPMNQSGGMLKDDSVQNLVATAQASAPDKPQPTTDFEIEHKVFIFDRDLLGPDAEQVAVSLAIEDDQVLTEAPLNGKLRCGLRKPLPGAHHQKLSPARSDSQPKTQSQRTSHCLSTT